MPRLLLSYILLLGSSFTLLAQSSAGTAFWLGYMENLTLAFNDAPAFSVIISTDTPANGSIDVPTTGLSIPFSVPVGSTEIFLPAAIYYSEGSEQIDNKGLRISSDTPIRVQAYHYRLYFSESSNVLPVTELGSEYLITSIVDENGPPQPGSMVIVATEDNTEIEITPSTLTLGLRPAGIPFTITLAAGQNYQLQALGELTGTRVRSLGNQPLAVFSGSQHADIIDGSCNGGADSHVWDQSLPLEDWRQLYYFVPFEGQGGDRVHIVAAEDNTTVFFDCENVAQLDRGEFHSAFVTTPTVISSTAPVSVTQYTNSFSCEPSQLGDPNGLSYLPADFVGTSFRWYASDRMNNTDTGRQFDEHFVTILGPADATANVTLDGVQVTGFTPFAGNPSWEYARVNVSPGEHELLAAEGVQAYSYGFGFADAYTNNLGYTAIAPQEYICLEIERDGVLCADSLQQFAYDSTLDLINFDWDFGDMTTSNLPEPSHTYVVPGIYVVTLTASDATGTSVNISLTITIGDCTTDCSDLVIEEVLIDGELCIDSLITFEGVYLSDEPVEAIWLILPEFVTSTGDLLTTSFEEAGEYDVVFLLDQATNNCEAEITIPVTIAACLPDCSLFQVEDIVVSGTLCQDSTLALAPAFTATPDSVSWQLPDGTTREELLLDDIIASAPGPYPVGLSVYWANGCNADTTVVLDIAACLPPPTCEVMIPNIFSPNNDGVNDGFRLFYAEECLPTNFELFLYNRWGNEVYRSTDPTTSWDGQFNGKPHPQEVLVYWCRYQLPDGTTEERKGAVTLIR